MTTSLILSLRPDASATREGDEVDLNHPSDARSLSYGEEKTGREIIADR
jgi:hypothetical protein